MVDLHEGFRSDADGRRAKENASWGNWQKITFFLDRQSWGKALFKNVKPQPSNSVVDTTMGAALTTCAQARANDHVSVKHRLR